MARAAARGLGGKTLTRVQPTTSAVLLLAANENRQIAWFANAGSVTVYLGTDNTVASTTGIPLAAGATFIDDQSTDAWWCIAASSTGDMRVLQVV